jgi:hypothetical protein
MNRARHGLPKLALLAGIAVASFAFSFTAQAQTVNEMDYTGYSWTVQSLFGTQGGDDYPGYSGIAAFITTPNNQMHVYYAGVDYHMHQLYPNGSGAWNNEHLTAETHAPLAGGERVTGFSQGNFQYVFYGDTNNHIHQLLFNNSNWSDSDITSAGGAPLWGDVALSAITTTPNNQVHVYYGSDNGDIHQLFFNGSSWSDGDLTVATRARQVGLSNVAASSVGNYQYLFYISPQGDVHEMFYNNIGLVDVDLTAIDGAPIGWDFNLAALVVPGTQTFKVYYLTGDSDAAHMTELTTSNNFNWTKADLTSLAGGPPVNLFQVVAFATTPNNQLHVYYAAESTGNYTDVHQLFFNGSKWSDEDLTTETHTAGIDSGSGMGGFAIGNSLYVFYAR